MTHHRAHRQGDEMTEPRTEANIPPIRTSANGQPNVESLQREVAALKAILWQDTFDFDGFCFDPSHEAEAAAQHPDAGLREALRQIHAAHDVGHKAGAWPTACMGCDMFRRALAADTPSET